MNTGISCVQDVRRRQKMSSREIAEVTGTRHDNVWRTIESLHAKGLIGLPQFEEVPNPGPGPLAIKQYLVCKRDSFVIVARLSPEFTAALVDRWQELEAAQQPALPNFTNPAESARAWAEQFERRQVAEHALAIATPKADFVDRYVDGTGLKGFRQVAKLLKANEREFRDFLKDRHIMYVLNGNWTAYQAHIDAGRFEVKTGTAKHSDHAFVDAKFTAKGVAWVAELWVKSQEKAA